MTAMLWTDLDAIGIALALVLFAGLILMAAGDYLNRKQ